MLAEGWVVLSVDIASHSLRSSSQPLMGQRVADMLAGVSILAARPEVDASRLGTVGLSLGKLRVPSSKCCPVHHGYVARCALVL
jgi:dienelactone hydrolase